MNIALILSGGTGTRINSDIPKQYIRVDGENTVLYFGLKTLMMHDLIDAVVIVADSDYHEVILGEIEKIEKNNPRSCSNIFKGFAEPGQNRQLSILNGLREIRKFASDADSVLIHDAARPMLSAEMISECFEAYIGHEGVMPVLPMKDTVYMSSNAKNITSLLDRRCIFAGQAPELFLIGKYYEACQELLPDKILDIHGSSEPAVLNGMDVVIIPGDEKNFKITTNEDLERFREIMAKANF